jgi:hypothetical protein
MSPLSGGVLLGSAVVASPALWAGLVDGTMPLDVALTRYLIVLVICWAAISVVADLAFPAPGSVKPRTEGEAEREEPESPRPG